ncbi:hypothetical protein [Bifidobacterium moukalabense]|uniref:Uncharacterized protein n=1 Tax=Bifidobacterium moukalabense DSM 27321 TaxID=1435051 RepID=W4NB10_9BIFI|nr:hypothetical protein [Bifidobacterium moukalabense]ETY71666.1 hypothetical protein BMOU_0744 [Bifidobacterium moukalabense DSM 27321]
MTDILNPPAPPARNRLTDPGDIHFISKDGWLIDFYAGNLGSLNMYVTIGDRPIGITLTPAQFETLAHWMQERVGATR